MCLPFFMIYVITSKPFITIGLNVVWFKTSIVVLINLSISFS